MRDLNSIKQDVVLMSSVALEMLKTTHSAFMEHDKDLIALALEKEDQLNALEKKISSGLVELGKNCTQKEDRQRAAVYADLAGDFELIGDYCKDILERVQIKIEEKLLFSKEAVREYNDLYSVAEVALEDITRALKEDNLGILKSVLKNEQHIDSLVDEYRRRHNQRLLEGICTPMACNMFLNMLDFTAAIYYHIKKVARSLLTLKA